MPDLTITVGNISFRSDASGARLVQAGEAVTPMQPIYRDATTGKHHPADANDSLMAACVGLACTPASADEYFYLIDAGKVDVGATTVKGTTYIVSATAGGIAPITDLASGWYNTILGTAEDTTGTINLDIKATGQLKA